MAQTVSTTDWRHRSNDDALRHNVRRNIAPRHHHPQPRQRVTCRRALSVALPTGIRRPDDARPDGAEAHSTRRPTSRLGCRVPPNVGFCHVALRDEALRNDALHAIPGRMVVDVETCEVSVELPWLDYRRRSTSAVGIDIQLNAIVDRRIGLGVAGGARAKRAFDIVVTLLTAPVSAPAARRSRLRRGAPRGGQGFLREERVGRDGRLFRCVKLRTMASDAEHRLQLLRPPIRGFCSDQVELQAPRHPRITRWSWCCGDPVSTQPP